MHHGDGRLKSVRLEIRIELPKLTHEEHSLIDDRPAGKAHHIRVVIGLFKLPSRKIQETLKRQSLPDVFRLFHEALQDTGHAGQLEFKPVYMIPFILEDIDGST